MSDVWLAQTQNRPVYNQFICRVQRDNLLGQTMLKLK